jgi:two-component system response regulator DevR
MPPDSPDSAAPRRPALSPRERDILALLGRGLDNKSIAAHLGLTHGSVRNRLTALYRKLGVTSRTAAALASLHRH